MGWADFGDQIFRKPVKRERSFNMQLLAEMAHFGVWVKDRHPELLKEWYASPERAKCDICNCRE